MIDLDDLEDQLEQALAANLAGTRAVAPADRRPPSAVAPPPAPAPAPPVTPSPGRPRLSAPRPARLRRPASSPAPPPAPRPPARSGPARGEGRHRRATTPVVVDPAPAPAAPDGPLGLGDYARRITQLLAEGRLLEADLHIAAHAELVTDRGTPSDRRDAAAWATMRALLDGRGDDARRKAAEALALARRVADPGAESGSHWQRFWIAVEWGGEDERYDLLDQCRSRAYTHDELPWRAALTLLLAHLGHRDEAVRELDATTAECGALPRDAAWLDMVTNLAEAAVLLGDAERARRLYGWLARVPDQLVVVGPGDVCKGSLSRYRAGLAATVGASAEADGGFRVAVDVHRALGARPLLARTLHQWARTLAGRDELLARRNLQESEELAEELGLAGHGAGRGDPVVSTSA